MAATGISLKGLFDPGQFAAWTREQSERIRQQTGQGLLEAGKAVAAQADAQARSALHVQRRNFPNIRARLIDRDKSRLPALLVGSKIDFLGIHEDGGTITGRLVIPIGLEPGKRIGPKAFALLLQRLKSFLFYEKKGDTTLIFAENPSRKDRVGGLQAFQRGERARTGKRLKAGQSILIGVIVSRVTLRKRLQLREIVNANLHTLVEAVERKLQ